MTKKNTPKNILPPLQLALFTAIASNLFNSISSVAKYNAELRQEAQAAQLAQPEPEKADPGKTLGSRFFKKASPNATIGGAVPAAIPAGIDGIENAAETFVENNCPYIAAEDDLNNRFYLTQSVNIGRYPHNDIQILDEAVSRIHCRIYVSNGTYYLINMGASTPLKLNERDVDNYKPESEDELFRFKLHDGDRITIGRLTYYFRASSAGNPNAATFNRGNSTLVMN